MIKLVYISMLGLVLSSCAKDPVVETPTLTINLTDAGSVETNKPAIFTLSGNPNVISFYSGEVLNDYNFISGRLVEKGKVSMSFSSSVKFGTQQNQFVVLVSTDFNGSYKPNDVKAATWKDVTSRFILGTDGNYKDTKADLSDLVVDAKPLYISFKYTTLPQGANGSGRSWYVQNFVAESKTTIGTFELANQKDAGFSLVEVGEIVDPGRSSISSSTITLRANNTTTGKELKTEFFAITKALNAGSQDFGPDLAVPVKGLIDVTPEIFSHTYKKPGTYKATFVAANTTVFGEKKLVKSIEVVVK